VQVCPTGIDIRKGLQYECIGCAACIDVCDGVMDKMGYPRGLVRYDTQNGLPQHLGPQRAPAPHLPAAGAGLHRMLVVILLALFTSMGCASPFKVDVVRDRGVAGRVVDDGQVENVYRLQIMNATEQPAEARWVAVNVRVPPEAAAKAGPGSARDALPDRTARRCRSRPMGGAAVSEKSTFVVPR
jgi:polyferredoxin